VTTLIQYQHVITQGYTQHSRHTIDTTPRSDDQRPKHGMGIITFTFWSAERCTARDTLTARCCNCAMSAPPMP